MNAFERDEGGQAIVLIAITMLALLFAVGLAIDVGQLYNGRRTAQEAADAAAFAGAVVIYQQGTSAQATSAATADARLNGYDADTPTSGTLVTVQLPPLSGTKNGDSNCVQVIITSPVRTSLVPQQSQFTTVTARGTACYLPFSPPYALIAIDQTCTAGDVALQGNGSINIHGGGIQVNSCGSPAADNSHQAPVSIDVGFNVDVTGTVDNAANWPVGTRTGRQVQADPFATTPRPSATGLTDWGTPQCTTSAGTINQPGIYTSDAQSNCLYVFAPGTYIFKGAGFKLNGTNAAVCTGSYVNTTTNVTVSAPGPQSVSVADGTNITVGKMLVIEAGTAQEEGVVPTAVSGTTFTATFAKTHAGSYTVTAGCGPAGAWSTADGGVFFFLTTSNYPATTGSCGDFQLGGSAVSTISAPTSGTYKGMLLWYDKYCTSIVSIGGGGSIYSNGSIYAPSATVQGNGNNATVVVSQIVAKKVDTQNADFTMNYNADLNYQGRLPVLVE